MNPLDAAAVALPFVWFGLVAAISFVETPLKFRAAGVTLPVGLGIGRIMFRAVGRIEAVLLAALAVVLVAADLTDGAQAGLLVGLAVLLGMQVLVVRPRLARRSDAIIAGNDVDAPRSHLHLVFVGLDLVKLVLLAALGTAVLATLVP